MLVLIAYNSYSCCYLGVRSLRVTRAVSPGSDCGAGPGQGGVQKLTLTVAVGMRELQSSWQDNEGTEAMHG